MRSGRQILTLGPAILLAAACSAPEEVPGRTGEWLVDLGSVDCTPTPVVSFSADRNWLLFWIEFFRPDADMRAPVTSPALLEIDSRRLVLPAGPADRVEGPTFATSSLCWDDDNNRVFVRGGASTGRSESGWYRADVDFEAELVASSPPPESCRQPPAVEWRPRREWSIPDEVRGDLKISRDGCCAVDLRRRSDGVLLARHEARSELSDLVMVSRYAWSESMTRLVYRLNEETSWRFARPTTSFVLETPGEPMALEGQAYAFAWRGDEELIACASRPRADGGGNGLKIWHLPN